MDINEYQARCRDTAIYLESVDETITAASVSDMDLFLKLAYCVGKLNGEAGEVAEELFKALRDDKGHLTPQRYQKLFEELGDVEWYLSEICTNLGFKRSDVMEYNLTKLSSRKERGALSGSGSNR